MTKAHHSRDRTDSPVGSVTSKHVLATVVLSLLFTGCQWVDSADMKEAVGETAGGIVVVAAAEAQSQPDAEVPVVMDDLWVRIQSGLGMDLDQNNSRIQAELDWYTSHQYYFSQISKRSAPYLYFIVKEAEARQVPLELALMPIVESSFDPFAYSHAGGSCRKPANITVWSKTGGTTAVVMLCTRHAPPWTT